jgi:tight adherence protein C
MGELQFTAEIVVARAFIGIAGGVYALSSMFDSYHDRVQQRIDELGGEQVELETLAAGTGTAAAGVIPQMSQLVARWLPYRAGNRAQLMERFARAGIYHPGAAANYFVARFLLAVVPPAICVGVALAWSWRLETAMLLGCALGGLGSMLPSLWLDRQITAQHRMLRHSLPDFLDLMIVCLEGGLSIQESVRRVSDELQLAHPRLATELAIVQRDIELGSSVAQALKRFASRSDYDGVKTLGTFVREAQRFGTNLSEALRLHSDLLRTQREQAAEEMAQKAAVKILLPTLLCIFPAIFVVLVGPALIQIQEAFGAK